MKLSIIIPAYNTGEYLPGMLNSLFAQELTDCEVIVINDGSCDSTGEILSGYADKYKNMSVFETENRGLSAARNLGISKASGDYIYFVDSDDRIEKTAASTILSAISAHPDILGFSYIRDDSREKAPATVVFGTGRTESLLDTRFDYSLGYLTDKGLFGATVWNKVYRTDIIKQHELNFVDTSLVMSEDVLFNLEYIMFCENAVYIDMPLYRYFLRKGSLTDLSGKNDIRRIYTLTDLAENFYRENGYGKRMDIIEANAAVLMQNQYWKNGPLKTAAIVKDLPDSYRNFLIRILHNHVLEQAAGRETAGAIRKYIRFILFTDGGIWAFRKSKKEK